MSQNIVDSRTLAQKWVEIQRNKQDHPELYKLKTTGIKGLDNIIGGGVEPGQMLVVGGAQKSGKTTLLTVIAEAFAKQDMNIAYLTGEMTNLQTANLFFSRMARIDRTKIRAIELDELDWAKIDIAAQKLSEYHIWWNHGFSTIDDIGEICKEIETKNKLTLDAVFVDYLQLMEAPNVKGGRVQEIEYISRNLKRRSINGDGQKPLIMVVASQINRSSIRGSLLDANSFLGSGSIERDMDVGVIIHSAKNPTNPTIDDPFRKIITVVGSRESGVGSCTTIYNGSIALIEDLETDLPKVNILGDMEPPL